MFFLAACLAIAGVLVMVIGRLMARTAAETARS